MLFVDIARSTGLVRREKNLDHIGSLQAKELVGLCSIASARTEKYGSHWFPEGE